MVKRLFENSDKIGAASSILCLVHCLAFPVLIGFFPFVEMADPVELVFLAISIIAVALSVYNAQNKKSAEVFLMVSSLLALLFSVLLEHISMVFQVISVLAAISLAVAHYLSYRKQKH